MPERTLESKGDRRVKLLTRNFLQKHMGSKGDIAGIYGAVRKESGLEFEN